jgi:hypothetical protein
MTLPDGAAVVVEWSGGPSSVVAVCQNAERAADLFGADLVWTPPTVEESP